MSHIHRTGTVESNTQPDTAPRELSPLQRLGVMLSLTRARAVSEETAPPSPASSVLSLSHASERDGIDNDLAERLCMASGRPFSLCRMIVKRLPADLRTEAAIVRIDDDISNEQGQIQAKAILQLAERGPNGELPGTFLAGFVKQWLSVNLQSAYDLRQKSTQDY